MERLAAQAEFRGAPARNAATAAKIAWRQKKDATAAVVAKLGFAQAALAEPAGEGQASSSGRSKLAAEVETLRHAAAEAERSLSFAREAAVCRQAEAQVVTQKAAQLRREAVKATGWAERSQVVGFEVTFDMRMSQWEAQPTLKRAVRDEIAKVCGQRPQNVVIVSVLAGSVVVQVEVAVKAAGAADVVHRLDGLRAASAQG